MHSAEVSKSRYNPWIECSRIALPAIYGAKAISGGLVVPQRALSFAVVSRICHLTAVAVGRSSQHCARQAELGILNVAFARRAKG